MRAVIPVAGVGTRLRPHTYALPKVLLNVAGKPILAHIMDELIEQGIKKATIITGYMGSQVEEYVSNRYDIEIDFITQEETLGLGHAIWVARETYGSDPLMIVLGDTIFDVDLSKAFKSGKSSLGVKKVEDPRRFGVVVTDKKGEVKDMVEKPKEFVSDLALVGLYFVKNGRLLVDSLNELIEKNIKTKNEYQLTDALKIMIQKGEEFTTFPCEGWYDCGKPETLLSTNRFLLDKIANKKSHKEATIIPPVFVGEGCIIERSVIGPYATVADGAVVKDSHVRNSIVSDNATVTSSLLEESIIGNNALVKGSFNKLNVGNSSEIFFK